MKRIAFLFCGLFLLSQSGVATGIPMGVGAFAGLELPVVQDDQSQGTVYGLKGRLKLIPPITFEPNIAFTSYGDPELADVIGNPEGSKITYYGIDAVLGSQVGGPMFSVILFAGAGYYTIKNDQLKVDYKELGYSGGLGLEKGLGPALGVEARARFTVIPTDGGGSKKSASVTVGINYHFSL